jgi:SAM-dependent methyltransferase
MRIKADWITYLHQFRKREVDLIFHRCPAKAFGLGLELGAGDGFQSDLLSHYIARLVSTDYNQYRLQKNPTKAIKYVIVDAESIESTFRGREYDLIFSSNLLEHLPRPDMALRGMYQILRDDGIMIHVMPSPFWKLCQLVLYHANLLVTKIERYTERERFVANNVSERGRLDNLPMINNLKSMRQFPRWARLLLPPPHGACGGTLEELRTFRKQRWKALFEQHGFQVWQIRKGPVASGYGFGFDSLRSVLEGAGLTSVYIYITAKVGCMSPHLKHFG